MRRIRLLWFLTALPLILLPPLLMGMGPIEWPRWFDRFVPRKADGRVAGYWTVGASSAIGVDGAFTAGTAPGAAAATDTLRFGNYGNTAARVQTGWYSSFCYDVDPTRCR